MARPMSQHGGGSHSALQDRDRGPSALLTCLVGDASFRYTHTDLFHTGTSLQERSLQGCSIQRCSYRAALHRDVPYGDAPSDMLTQEHSQSAGEADILSGCLSLPSAALKPPLKQVSWGWPQHPQVWQSRQSQLRPQVPCSIRVWCPKRALFVLPTLAAAEDAVYLMLQK